MSIDKKKRQLAWAMTIKDMIEKRDLNRRQAMTELKDIKQIKDMTNWEAGKLMARKMAFWASDEHSKLVQARIKKNSTISEREIAEMAGEMRAYIKIMEEASALENMCKLYQERG